jgi:hypothetical protein
MGNGRGKIVPRIVDEKAQEQVEMTAEAKSASQPMMPHVPHQNTYTDALPIDTTMAQRVTLRKRQPYNTVSNRRRVVKTPGGKLVYHHLKKLPTQPKCGDCGIGLPGVRPLGPFHVACR